MPNFWQRSELQVLDGQFEYLDGMIFPGSSLQHYEDWLLGAPELKVTILKPINNFTTLGEFYSHYYEPAHRSFVNNSWGRFYGQWPLFPWVNLNYGSTVIYQWVEEDSGSLIKLDVNATISGVGLKGIIDIHNNDDPITTVPVEQTDCRATKVYGGIEFQFEIKHF